MLHCILDAHAGAVWGVNAYHCICCHVCVVWPTMAVYSHQLPADHVIARALAAMGVVAFSKLGLHTSDLL